MNRQPDLYDLAHAEAQRLRREAVADFWRGADALVERAGLSLTAQVARSARLLHARLARRAALRAAIG